MEGKDGALRISIQIKKPDLRALAVDWSVPLLFALLTVLGALQLFDTFEVVYYPMIHGAMSTIQFDQGLSFVLPLIFFLLIWISWVIFKRRFLVLLFPVVAISLYPLTSLEAAVSIGSLLAVVGGLWAHREIERYLSVVLVFLGSLEVLALLHWAIYLPVGLSSQFRWYAEVEMGLYYLGAQLAPFLVIPLMYIWVLKLLVYWRGRKEVWLKGLEYNDREGVSQSALLILLLSISLGVVAALYPYLPSVNPRNRNVGLDFSYYVEVEKIIENDFSQVFNAYEGSRPMIHIIIHVFRGLFGLDEVAAIKFFPVFLNPLLAFSIFFLALEMFNDGWIASWAAFFTICGIHVSVGMFSYYLTNMLALSIVFLSLGFLFRALQYMCYINLIFASLIGIFLVFTHPWTFDQYFVVILLMALFVLRADRKSHEGYNKFKLIIVYLFFLGLSEVVKSILFRGYGGMSASNLALGDIININRLWDSTVFFLSRKYCGLEANIISIALSVITIFLLKKSHISEVFLLGFLAVSSLPFLFGDANIKSRLMYNIPIGLYVAYSFNWLNRQKNKNLKISSSFFVLSNMIVYLIRTMANII